MRTTTIAMTLLVTGLVACGGDDGYRGPEPTGAMAPLLAELETSKDCFGTAPMGESYAGGGDAEASVWSLVRHHAVSGNRELAAKWIATAKANCPEQGAKLDELLEIVAAGTTD